MNEVYLPICTNDSLKKAIAFIRLNYQSDIAINDVAGHTEISERCLRRFFSRIFKQQMGISPREVTK